MIISLHQIEYQKYIIITAQPNVVVFSQPGNEFVPSYEQGIGNDQ
jgi:hypothetical protein